MFAYAVNLGILTLSSVGPEMFLEDSLKWLVVELHLLYLSLLEITAEPQTSSQEL